MKRQTVTLPRKEFYDKVKDLRPEIKNQVINAILDLFFEERQINYSEYEESAQIALALIAPDLRRVQSQFDNSRLQKKSKQNSQGLFCPNGAVQNSPNLTNNSQDDSSILNNNIYNIYNNKSINQSNQENKTTPNNKEKPTYTPNPEAMRFYIESLEYQINETLAKSVENEILEAPTLLGRMRELINSLSKEKHLLKINNEYLEPEKVIHEYLTIFSTLNTNLIIHRLQTVFDKVDNLPNINNKYKYLATAMYNEARGL